VTEARLTAADIMDRNQAYSVIPNFNPMILYKAAVNVAAGHLTVRSLVLQTQHLNVPKNTT
jgi:hypothetical protein